MVSLTAVTNRKAAERIQARLTQHGIRTKLEASDPCGLIPSASTGRPLTHILVAETDLARAREILNARREGA
ncbi:MAG: putative signal transducing protein [Candidatus Methylomirabilales bacterium]